MRFTRLAQRVRAHLGQDQRYEHSVRVARCADVLAQRHRLNAGKARVAGLLHDLARLYTPQRLLAECAQRGMAIDEFELAHPMLLHARLGAVLARELFGVADPEVLSAIEKHTTGAGSMSPLDCAVYVADTVEPGRTFEGRSALWDLALRDLHQATREAILLGVRHYARKGRSLAPQAAAAAAAFDIDQGTLREVYASAS